MTYVMLPLALDIGQIQAAAGYRMASSGLVEVGNSMYAFYVDGSAGLAYRKSLDHGLTWQAAVVIHAATYERLSVWFDQWTPGDSGTVIHIWGIDATADDANYFSLDTSNDTLGNGGSAVVVFNGASVAPTGAELAGTKTRGGNLLVAFNLDGGTETGFYRSTDGGANWTSRASPVEAAVDLMLMFPGNEADNQDAWCIYWDISANEISLKVYDDSGDSWAETSISTGMIDVTMSTANPQFSGVIRPSDNHLLLAAWNDRDTGTADLTTWDINGAGSITAKTNIISNTDDCQCIALSLLPTGELVATYVGKSDGSETVSTAVGIYQKRSLDGMTTWLAEETVWNTPLMEVQKLMACPRSTKSPFASWMWQDFGGPTTGVEAWWVGVKMASPRAQSLIGV